MLLKTWRKIIKQNLIKFKSLLVNTKSFRKIYIKINNKEKKSDCFKENLKYINLNKNPNNIASNLKKVPVLKKYELKKSNKKILIKTRKVKKYKHFFKKFFLPKKIKIIGNNI